MQIPYHPKHALQRADPFWLHSFCREGGGRCPELKLSTCDPAVISIRDMLNAAGEEPADVMAVPVPQLPNEFSGG